MLRISVAARKEVVGVSVTFVVKKYGEQANAVYNPKGGITDGALGHQVDDCGGRVDQCELLELSDRAIVREKWCVHDRMHEMQQEGQLEMKHVGKGGNWSDGDKRERQE